MKIKFDQLSEMAKWLVCHMLTYVPDEVWYDEQDGSDTDFEFRVNGYKIDTTKFIEGIARAIEETIERDAKKRAAQLGQELLGDIQDDICLIREEITQKLCDALGISKESIQY